MPNLRNQRKLRKLERERKEANLSEMADDKKEAEAEAMEQDEDGAKKEGSSARPQNWFRFNGLNREDAPAKQEAAPEAVEATVVAAFLNGVFVAWEGEGGKKKCARLTPGKAYLNGRRNLQSVFRWAG